MRANERRRKPKLLILEEPRLLFNYEQATEDPRDGLMLFGPLETGKPYGIRFAVVGTADGIRRFRAWVAKVQLPIGDAEAVARPSFPGFHAAFGIPWKPKPEFEIGIDATELRRRINYADKHHRVYTAVDLYEQAILNVVSTEESPVDVWFVIIPDELYRNCRPQSTILAANRVESTDGLPTSLIKAVGDGQTLMFGPLDLAEEVSLAAVKTGRLRQR